MLFTTALPQLPAGPRRASAPDVAARPGPIDWPFTQPLNERQRAAALDGLTRADARHEGRRFTGAVVTGFGEFA